MSGGGEDRGGQGIEIVREIIPGSWLGTASLGSHVLT